MSTRIKTVTSERKKMETFLVNEEIVLASVEDPVKGNRDESF